MVQLAHRNLCIRFFSQPPSVINTMAPDSINPRSEGWIVTAQKIALTQGVGWIFAAAILYALYVEGPKVINHYSEAQSAQAERFSNDLKEIIKDTRAAAEARDGVIERVLAELRRDEVEDRRLLVELVKRSNITAEGLQDALEAAVQDADAYEQITPARKLITTPP